MPITPNTIQQAYTTIQTGPTALPQRQIIAFDSSSFTLSDIDGYTKVIGASTGIGGTAALNRVAYGSGTNTLTSSSNFTYNGTTLGLTGALTQSGGAFSLTGNSQSQLTTTSGSTVIDSAGIIDLGVTTATGILIGRSGIPTTITGAFTQQTGAFSITGNATSTITTSAGNLSVDAYGTLNIGHTTATGLVIGGSGITTAMASNQINVGPGSGSTNLLIVGATQAAVDTAGVGLTLASSAGGAASATAGGAGGFTTVRAATGGAGTGALNPGNGGVLTLQSGTPGTGGSGNANSGTMALNIPAPSGTGSSGQFSFQFAGTNKVILVSTGVFAPSTTNTGGLGNSSNVWGQTYSTSVSTNTVDAITGTTLFLGNGVATATSVGSANTITYLSGSSLATGTGNVRSFNPLYIIGSSATSGTTSVNSPYSYQQANYWNGTASTTFYGGSRTLVTSAGKGFMEWGLGFSSPNSAMRLDAYGNLSVVAGGGIDTISSGALIIGGTNATSTTIGLPGFVTSLNGDVQSDGSDWWFPIGQNFLIKGAPTGSSTLLSITSDHAMTTGDKFLSLLDSGGNGVYVHKETVADIYVIRSTGNFMGMQNANGDGIIAQGANLVYVYGANAPQMLFTANTSITNPGAFPISFGASGNEWDSGYFKDGFFIHSMTITGSLTQSAGAVSLTGNAASTLKTTSGALNLDGYAGINMNVAGANAIVLDNARSKATFFVPNILFNTTVSTAPMISQLTAASTAGQNLTVSAQGTFGTSVNGGNLILSSGSANGGGGADGYTLIQTGNITKITLTPTQVLSGSTTGTIDLGSSTNYWGSTYSKHYNGAGGSPTISVAGAPTQLGTGVSATITGFDSDGYVKITTGTTPAAFVTGTAITVATITLNSTSGATIKSVMLEEGNSAAALISLSSGSTLTNGIKVYIDVASSSASSWVIKAISQTSTAVPTAAVLPASTALIWQYHVMS